MASVVERNVWVTSIALDPMTPTTPSPSVPAAGPLHGSAGADGPDTVAQHPDPTTSGDGDRGGGEGTAAVAVATVPTPRRRPWQAVITVVAMASWPFLNLIGDNLGQPLDLAAIRTWWLVTLGVSLALLAVAVGRAAGGRIAGWAGGVLGVVLWSLFSLPLFLGLRDVVNSSLTDPAWWAIVAIPIVVVATAVMWSATAQRFTAIMAVVLAGAAATQIGVGVMSAQADDAERADVPAAAATFTTTPNVWFIVLDGLGSNDFMRERTDYDPIGFEQALETDGFVIQQDATSNYPLTNLSISSTLMMDYGFEGVDEPPAGPFFERLTGDNATVELMRANGYSYAHTYPGLWSGSKCGGREDLCIGDQGSVTETETAIAAMTPMGGWLTNRTPQEDVAISNDPSHIAAQVVAADLPAPQFTFLHVLNPHPPLLRDAECDVRDVPFTFSAWGIGPEYADAVTCLHGQLEDAVDTILAADDDPLIIIQGDHGPRLGIDWTQPGGVFLENDMYFSILSAIRMPAQCSGLAIPDDLTPVNTFRIVRACLDDTEPVLLPNRRFPIQAERG